MTKEQALFLLLQRPDLLGRLCGCTLLQPHPHGDWIKTMVRGTADWTLLAHRGSYKTTCAALAMAELMLLLPERNLLFFRKTDEGAAEIIRQVARLLEHPVFRRTARALWGQHLRLKRKTQLSLTTSLRRGTRGADQLLGCGIGTSLTGKHAELLFTDDIVTLQDRLSPVEREKTRQVYMELQNLRMPGGRIINTATPWHPDDAVSLMPNPARFDCRATGLLDESAIRRLQSAMTPGLFAANYLLLHRADEEALFPSAPPLLGSESDLADGFAQVDCAYGGQDGTALTCAKWQDGHLYLYGRLWNGHVDRVQEEIAGICRRMGLRLLLVETNADKGYAARAFRRLGLTVRMYHERENKYMKIATHLRACWPNVVLVRGTDEGYLRQILDYRPNAAHDDAPDSAASLCRYLKGDAPC